MRSGPGKQREIEGGRFTSSAVGRAEGSNARSFSSNLSAVGSALGKTFSNGTAVLGFMLARNLRAFSFRTWRKEANGQGQKAG